MLRAEMPKRGGSAWYESSRGIKGETGITVSYEMQMEQELLQPDKLMMSVSRRPVTKGFGLENPEFGMDGTQMHQK